MEREEILKIQKNQNLQLKIRTKQLIVMSQLLLTFKDRFINWVLMLKIIWNQKTYRVFADQEETQIIRKRIIEAVYLSGMIILD